MAPDLGFRSWLQCGGHAPRSLAKLRGRVVIVHTFAWNCSSCVRVGIPLVVDLLAANEDRGLSVISVTTPAMRSETKGVVEKFGMKHPIATAHPTKSTSPYINMNNGFTYFFVIGRNGDLIWRGNPSTKTKDCLEALRVALNQEPGRELDRDLHPKLGKAVRYYFAGEYARARKDAAKLAARHARSKRGESPAITAGGNWLVEHVDWIADEIIEKLEAAGEKKGEAAAEFLAAKAELKQGFGGGPVWKRAAHIVKAVEDDADAAESLARAAAWRGTRAARPALFPTRARPGEQEVRDAAEEVRRPVRGQHRSQGGGRSARPVSLSCSSAGGRTQADSDGILLAEALLMQGAVTPKDWAYAIEEAPRRTIETGGGLKWRWVILAVALLAGTLAIPAVRAFLRDLLS